MVGMKTTTAFYRQTSRPLYDRLHGNQSVVQFPTDLSACSFCRQVSRSVGTVLRTVRCMGAELLRMAFRIGFLRGCISHCCSAAVCIADMAAVGCIGLQHSIIELVATL